MSGPRRRKFVGSTISRVAWHGGRGRQRSRWALIIGLAGRDGAAAGGAASGRAPERGAAPPAEEPNSRSSSEVFRQLGLGNRDEAGAHPDAVESLRTGVDGVDAI